MECIYDIIIRPLKELEPTPGNLDETLSQAVFSTLWIVMAVG